MFDMYECGSCWPVYSLGISLMWVAMMVGTFHVAVMEGTFNTAVDDRNMDRDMANSCITVGVLYIKLHCMVGLYT